jgi:hypothetical protein
MATKTKQTVANKKNAQTGSVKPIPRWKLVLYYVVVGLIAFGVVLFLQSHSI